MSAVINMSINDRRVRDALEVITAELEASEIEIHNLGNEISNLEHIVESKDIQIDRLMNDIEELSSEVKRLDDALADTYIAQLDPKASPREF